jgi:hypothetical protein
MAVMTRSSSPSGPRYRILIVLAAAWFAISLAIGGWVVPDDDGVAPAQATTAREAAGP